MPISRDKPAPYAPAKAILDVLERHRAKGLPSPIDKEVLGRSGISDSLISRTLQALQTLDLVNEDGTHTQTWEGLRLAPEVEYKDRMREWLNAAYADVLQFVDPATDNETSIRDAFRPFKPTGMQDRMVTLFMGLYAAAGVGGEKQRTPGATPRPRPPRPTEWKRPAAEKQAATVRVDVGADGGLPAPILGLLANLPANGESWPKERRDSFVRTFEAVLDFCFPIAKATMSSNENGGPT